MVRVRVMIKVRVKFSEDFDWVNFDKVCFFIL